MNRIERIEAAIAAVGERRDYTDSMVPVRASDLRALLRLAKAAMSEDIVSAASVVEYGDALAALEEQVQ